MFQLSAIFTEDFLTMTVRLLLAALLSGFVGIEREIKKHPAGFRTHLLVGVGSCLMMLLSLYGFEPYLDQHSNIRFDPARIPSYVISGIGFLGAGTILVKGATVRGLTTAASIWVVAGLGLIVGIGMYGPAILATALVLLSLIFLNKFEAIFLKVSKHQLIHIIVEQNDHCLSDVIKKIESHSIQINQFHLKTIQGKKKLRFQYTFDIELKKQEDKAHLFEELVNIKGVQNIF